MEGILEVNVCIDAVVLNAIKLAADEGYRVMALLDEFVDADIVTTDPYVGWSGFGCDHDVATDRTVGREEKVAS